MPRPTSSERAVRIELLRAKAALERQSLAHNVSRARRDMDPSRLLRSVGPKFVSSRVTGLVSQAITLARRYPVISSTLSSVLLGRGRFGRLAKLASVGMLAMQVARWWRTGETRPPDRD